MHKVKCFFCGKQFDRDKEPCVKVSEKRYAHIECAKKEDPNLIKEQQDKDAFYQMVKDIYGKDYNFLMIQKQATTFIKQYGYTWSGMMGCLHWFYHINNGSLEDGHGGIGIIPFIYDQCRKYYQDIYKAQEKNKEVKELRQVIDFNIQSPRAWQRPPHLLDLEENDE